MTSPIDEATVRDRQARIAERIVAEPDPHDVDVRHLLLDGRRLGRVVWTGGRWAVHYRVGDTYVDSLNHLLAESADDTDEADRHGVGWLADAIARGELDVGGQR